jgi:arginyl-tRNA--protein-N-Asp/Glu arginylyltransferase
VPYVTAVRRKIGSSQNKVLFLFYSIHGCHWASFYKLQHQKFMDSYHYIAADEKGFKADTLDELLAIGYYRMQHLMFTCNDTLLGEDGPVIPVFWLRTLVQQCRLPKTANSILKKCQEFSVSVQPACVDDEVETLYSQYKNHVPFSVSPSCADYLHQEIFPQPFDSMMVQVRHYDQLIANGYFDKGGRSISGIMNIYHPQYNKYSLGKFLMLQKLQYARSQNKLFYYTGYISTGSSRFDYKTFPDPAAVEVLLPDRQVWVPYHLLSKAFLNEYYLKVLA